MHPTRSSFSGQYVIRYERHPVRHRVSSVVLAGLIGACSGALVTGVACTLWRFV